MLRRETKRRARALQILYAWELQGRPPIELIAHGLQIRGAEVKLALAVADHADALDRQIEDVADNWRLERIGTVERNVLRLALHELKNPDLPAPVAINEAVRLARWFAGPRAPGFVNGVLDTLARRLGRL